MTVEGCECGGVVVWEVSGVCVFVCLKGCEWWCGVSVVGCDCGRVRVLWCVCVFVCVCIVR